METKNYFAQDAQGNIMPSANCYLYLPGTTTLAAGLVDGNGVPISNPFLASGMGQITFGAPNGVYDLRVALGARDWTIKVQCADIVQAMDVMDSILGSHAENPTTRNNGQPLEAGDETWNSTDKQPYWWSGSAWVALNSSAHQLEQILKNATNPQNGAGAVGLYDPLAPAFLKVTSDILNFEPVHLFRIIPKAEWAKIGARTSDYLCTAGFNSLLSAMRDQKKGKLVLPRGLMLLDGRVGLDFAEAMDIEIIGEIGAELRNMAYTPTLVLQGSATNFIKAKISNLKVTMNNPDGFTGIMGPKSVFIRYSTDSEISNVIEEGAIGFGISMQNSVNPLVNRCIARNHKGGAGGSTGTDGIHLTAVTNPTIIDSYGENMADDCVSVGSFDPAWPSTNVKITRCGGRNSTGSAIKLYRMVDGATITDPWADGTNVGGVSLYDDRSDSASTYARYIRDVTVKGLKARNIKNTVGAYSRAPFNIYAQNGTQSSEFSDIRFLDSNANDCIAGAVTKIDAVAAVRNLEISRFVMRDQVITTGLNPCILVQGVQGRLTLHGNRGENLAEGLISLDNQPASFSNSFNGSDISIKDNYAKNYGQSLPVDPVIMQAAIFVRPSDKTMTVNMSGNEAYGRILDFSTGSRAPFQFGGDVSPLSFVDSRSNISDEKTSIVMSLGGAGLDGARLNAAPATGTWLLGWSVFNTLFVGAAGTVRTWECSVAGTFGALSGITASGEANTNLIELNDGSALYPGVFITIGSAKYRVLKVAGNQIRVDAKLSSSISAVSVQYTPPVFSAITA